MIKIRFLASFGIFAFVHHKTATGLYLGVLELNLRVSVADECFLFLATRPGVMATANRGVRTTFRKRPVVEVRSRPAHSGCIVDDDTWLVLASPP
jgi:hypothetical protein